MGANHDLSREDLLRQVRELEALVETCERERAEQDSLAPAWTGNLGGWSWELPTGAVRCDPRLLTALGILPEEIPAGATTTFFTAFLHEEDRPATVAAMRAHLSGEAPGYEAEHRVRTRDGGWLWLRGAGRITRRDEGGRPLRVSGVVYDVSERRQLQQRLEQQVTEDDQTGLLNRRAVCRRLEEEMMRTRRYRTPLTILMLDLDHFRQINERFGYPIGDQVLALVAGTLRRSVRSVDILGRYGGEEFLVVLPNTLRTDAQVVAERIRVNIRAVPAQEGLQTTVSGGLAVFSGQPLSDLLGAAEENLKRAKQEGRDRIIG